MADKEATETVDDTPETGNDAPPETGDAQIKAALRKANAEAAKARHEAAEFKRQLEAKDAASKSDMERLLAKFDAMEKRAEKAEREAMAAKVADEMGLTQAQAGRLRGNTREELMADAEELVEAFGVKPSKATTTEVVDDDAADETKPTEDAKPPSVGRPKEKLRGGASPPDTEEPVDHAKLAASILDSPY